MGNTATVPLHERGANPLVPQVGRIIKIIDEAPDVKTFHVTTEKGKPFSPMPGQLAMLSLPQVGEAMFSVTWQGENHLEFAIKKIGVLTEALHEAVEGQMVGIRGPYGNGFPVEDMKGKDILFIGGGIGLAPIRSLINYCAEHRKDFGHMWIIYGARSPADLCFKKELFEEWPRIENCRVDVTVDKGDENWKGPEGFVPAFLEQLNPSPEGKIAVTCGPPIMIKFVLQALDRMGYKPEQIITTLEMRMKCGIGKCGRCNLGSLYVCLDGPVFTLAQLNELPSEY
ncbi:MAG: FAD/NAD(P)-binding protein [Clostridia bacterium]|nr:FAD/NAD(P)-binding protein [Clostridia bacterium]